MKQVLRSQIIFYYLSVAEPELESRISKLVVQYFFSLPVNFELEQPIDLGPPVPHVVPTRNVFYFLDTID